MNKIKALVKGYEEVRVLEPLEKDNLQLAIQYAAASTSWWRFCKYNIHSPEPSLKDKHMEMVLVAIEVQALRKEHFSKLVFEA